MSIVALSLLLFVGCKENQPQNTSREPIKVSVEKVEPITSNVTIRYVGVVEEKSSAALSFLVGGTISQCMVHEGQPVRKGDLLVKISAPSLDESLITAKAKYDHAVDAHKRMKKLYDSESLPEAKYVEVEAGLRQAESMYNIAKNNVEDTYLYAPFNGVIGERKVSVGESVIPAQPVLTLLETNKTYMKISVPEQDILNINKGDEALLSGGVLNGKSLAGKVLWRGVVADPITNNYEVMIDVDSENNVLLPGMICDVVLNSNGDISQFEIPNRAISLDETNKTFVWLIKNGIAQRKEVKVGGLTARGVAVLSGLNIGDEYVIDGYHKLSNGLKVEVK